MSYNTSENFSKPPKAAKLHRVDLGLAFLLAATVGLTVLVAAIFLINLSSVGRSIWATLLENTRFKIVLVLAVIFASPAAPQMKPKKSSRRATVPPRAAAKRAKRRNADAKPRRRRAG
jgi:hypothetical protein